MKHKTKEQILCGGKFCHPNKLKIASVVENWPPQKLLVPWEM